MWKINLYTVKQISMITSATLIISGCSSYPGAYFSEYVEFGLDVSTQLTEEKPIHINFGYDREIATIAPKTAKNSKVASLVSTSDVQIKFYDESTTFGLFISGEAADKITKSKDGMNFIFNTHKEYNAKNEEKNKKDPQ